jgi:hypothetical protein
LIARSVTASEENSAQSANHETAIQRRLEKWIVLIRGGLRRFLIGTLCRLEMLETGVEKGAKVWRSARVAEVCFQ